MLVHFTVAKLKILNLEQTHTKTLDLNPDIN